MKRIHAIDFTRGLVMVIMALDHTRDLMHLTSLTLNPTDLSSTTPALFFTRWITHLCAPTFVFLSGTSAYLSYQNQKNTSNAQSFLRSRGLWLIILEFTVISFALWFDIRFKILFFQVIGAIGLGFIILSFMLKLSSKTIGIIGLVIVFGHNLLQLVPFNEPPFVYFSFLFGPNVFPITPDFTFAIGYPPIPWLGIMLVGFACGKVFELPLEKRKRTLLQLGLGSLILFTILRFINVYGDPVKWTTQKDMLFTFFSFINVNKYPPSLLYSLITLGIMFLILYISDGVKNKFIDIISVYGKVPLFYYLIHWYIIHLTMFAMVFLQGATWKDLAFGPFQFGRPLTGTGVSLPITYLIWFGIILLLYPLCRWYGKYKDAHRDNKWLRYL